MAVELMLGYRNDNFATQLQENEVQEAACNGLENVEKLLKLFSQKEQKGQSQLSSPVESSTEQKKLDMEVEMDCKDVTDAAVNKFKKVISLLGRTRTGHARFRRGPVAPIPIKDCSTEVPDTKVYCPTPIQQIRPVDYHLLNHHHHQSISESENRIATAFSQVPKSGVVDGKEPISRSISFSYSPAISHANSSFMSSLTGETESKQLSSSSAFQMTNLSQVSSAGKPPLSSSSSFKRKCISENGISGKCSASSSGRCHCSKKR